MPLFETSDAARAELHYIVENFWFLVVTTFGPFVAILLLGILGGAFMRPSRVAPMTILGTFVVLVTCPTTVICILRYGVFDHLVVTGIFSGAYLVLTLLLLLVFWYFGRGSSTQGTG